MTDYLPNEVDGYQITPDVLASFKTAMHQLCDEERIDTRSLLFALEKGLDELLQLLLEIQRKEMNPKPHLYTKLWEDTISSYHDDECIKKYNDWHQEMGSPSFDNLKVKQKQEIYAFLKTGFLRHAITPSGGEVKKRKLVITEDDLMAGSQIDGQFEIECAKLDRFIEMKEGCILVINGERMGQYIYKNFNSIGEEGIFHIASFSNMMDLIHEDMAKLKPALAKHLKRYQEQQNEELLKDIQKIFNPFKNYLTEGLRDTLVNEYLEKLLFNSELKEEAKKMLSGQSRKKYCCSIAIALSLTYIFKPENNGNEDLAKALYNGLMTDNKETLLRYLKDKANFNQALNSWTSSIMDDLKEHPFSRTQTGQSKNIIP